MMYCEDTKENYEEITDPKHPLYDPNWFEIDCIPEDDPWFFIIGDFLYMRTMVAKYEYTGKNKKLKSTSSKHLNSFKKVLPDIEDLIRYKIDNLEFAEKWGEFCKAFTGLNIIKAEQKDRQIRGKYDRGTDKRKAWFSRVFLAERAKGHKGADVKRAIAKLAEQIKEKEIPAPALWNENNFDLLLHNDSNIGSPGLALTFHRKLTEKSDMPYYAIVVAPIHDLPPTNLKLPYSN